MGITGKEKLSSLRKKLNDEMVKRGAGRDISSYAIMFNNGYWRLQVDDVCFARSSYSNHYDKEDIAGDKKVKELVFSLIPGKKAGAAYDFVNYVLTRSVFKDLFLTKSPQAAWRYGVQMDVDADFSQVVAAMIAVRESWEFPYIVKNWRWLCRKGVNENVAWLCARFFRGEVFYAVQGVNEHQCLGDMSLKDAKTLLTEGLAKTESGTLAEGATRYYVFKSTRSTSAGIKDILEKGSVERGEGWVKYKKVPKKQMLENIKALEKELLS